MPMSRLFGFGTQFNYAATPWVWAHQAPLIPIVAFAMKVFSNSGSSRHLTDVGLPVNLLAFFHERTMLPEEMMTIRRALLFASLWVSATEAAPVYAAAFTCPDTSATGMAGQAPSLNDLYAGATDATASQRLGELMADLRKSGLKPSMIVDHLVGAYCPLVAADASLSDQQKTDRVRRFAQQVTGLAYAPSDTDEVDVFVQTTLTPELLTRIDEAAKRGGVSRDEWIAQAIQRQLAGP
jgi:hypothetical protein